jgi:predicted P-loop ATPase
VIDRDAIARDRDQIWAEALSLYRAGARWWPDTAEEKELLAAEVQKRTVADTWEDKVSQFLEGRSEVDMADVFTHLGIDHSDHNPASIKRLGQVLGVLGWEKTRAVQASGKRKTVWVRPTV